MVERIRFTLPPLTPEERLILVQQARKDLNAAFDVWSQMGGERKAFKGLDIARAQLALGDDVTSTIDQVKGLIGSVRHDFNKGNLLRGIAQIHAELGNLPEAFETANMAAEKDPGVLSYALIDIAKVQISRGENVE